MRELMTRLSSFLRRHRRVVLAVWALVLVLALPFASRQTEHLTGGGFDVPGSQSKAVNDSLEREFGKDAGGIAVVLRADAGAGAAARAAAIARVRDAVSEVDPRSPRARPVGNRDAAAAHQPHRRPTDRRRRQAPLRPRTGDRPGWGDDLSRRPADDLGRIPGTLEGRPRRSRDERLPDRRDHPP